MSEYPRSNVERIIVVSINCINEAEAQKAADFANTRFDVQFVTDSVKNYLGQMEYYASARFPTSADAARAFMELEQYYGNVELSSFWHGIHVAQNDALHTPPN